MNENIEEKIEQNLYKETEDLQNALENTEVYHQIKIPRGPHGRLLPGHGSLNPGGKPKDIRNAQANLMKALKKIEKIKGISGGYTFLEHYVKEAFKDKVMAIALLKKIVPDLKSVDVTEENKEVWQVILQSFNKPDDKPDDKTEE